MTIDERHDTASETSERVRALLAAAGAPAEPGPVHGESEALEAFRAAHPHERTRMLSTMSPTKVALATSATIALVLAGAFSAAAAGALPGAAQDTAHDVLAKIGVTVPGPNEASDGHPDNRGSSGQDDAEETTSPEETTDTTETDEDSLGKGAEISELAKTTDATGVDKGAEISTAASGGKSQAGQHGAPAETPKGPPEDAGAPDGAGRPADAGKPDDAGRPEDAGKPDDPGKPADAGKPDEQAHSPN
jgi:hypothetical protein